jgi:hypothetical protein
VMSFSSIKQIQRKIINIDLDYSMRHRTPPF